MLKLVFTVDYLMPLKFWDKDLCKEKFLTKVFF
ncbi:hypothetical protein ABIB40_002471 [Pedobacter sp. UYP30]